MYDVTFAVKFVKNDTRCTVIPYALHGSHITWYVHCMDWHRSGGCIALCLVVPRANRTRGSPTRADPRARASWRTTGIPSRAGPPGTCSDSSASTGSTTGYRVRRLGRTRTGHRPNGNSRPDRLGPRRRSMAAAATATSTRPATTRRTNGIIGAAAGTANGHASSPAVDTVDRWYRSATVGDDRCYTARCDPVLYHGELLAGENPISDRSLNVARAAPVRSAEWRTRLRSGSTIHKSTLRSRTRVTANAATAMRGRGAYARPTTITRVTSRAVRTRRAFVPHRPVDWYTTRVLFKYDLHNGNRIGNASQYRRCPDGS